MPVKLSYQNVGTLPQVALWSKQIIPLESSETLRILSSSAKAMNDSVCYYGKQFNDSEGLTMQEFKDLGSQLDQSLPSSVPAHQTYQTGLFLYQSGT